MEVAAEEEEDFLGVETADGAGVEVTAAVSCCGDFGEAGLGLGMGVAIDGGRLGEEGRVVGR